uniref:Transmembrane protein n=1 Tax=Steinernema glaseri TaxID=37863 RepID=A0A1I7YDD2_9BILA
MAQTVPGLSHASMEVRIREVKAGRPRQSGERRKDTGEQRRPRVAESRKRAKTNVAAEKKAERPPHSAVSPPTALEKGRRRREASEQRPREGKLFDELMCLGLRRVPSSMPSLSLATKNTKSSLRCCRSKFAKLHCCRITRFPSNQIHWRRLDRERRPLRFFLFLHKLMFQRGEEDGKRGRKLTGDISRHRVQGKKERSVNTAGGRLKRRCKHKITNERTHMIPFGRKLKQSESKRVSSASRRRRTIPKTCKAEKEARNEAPRSKLQDRKAIDYQALSVDW